MANSVPFFGCQYIRHLGAREPWQSQQDPNSLTVLFATSSAPTSRIDAINLADRSEWWSYDGDVDLIDLVNALVDLSVEKGIPWMDKDLVPMLKAPELVAKAVLENPTQRAKSLVEHLGLAETAPESLYQLERALIGSKGPEPDSPQVQWDLVTDAAAFLGETFRCHFGGHWQWHNQFRTPFLEGVRGGGSPLPLVMVLNFWSKPHRKTYGLVTNFVARKMSLETK